MSDAPKNNRTATAREAPPRCGFSIAFRMRSRRFGVSAEGSGEAGRKKERERARTPAAGAAGVLFFRGRYDSGRSQLLIATVSEKITQTAVFADAVCDGKNDGQVAIVEDVAEESALRAAKDEQKNENPKTTVATEISVTVH